MSQDIFFEKRGSGPALVLIHGFPMNHHVWKGLAAELENQFTVYTPDLPGFGQSPILSQGFSINDVAHAMNQWLGFTGLDNAVVIGHSLGGYVVLAMQKLNPALCKGFGLLHSTPLADSQEKKDSRTKVIKFIEDNGVLAFTSNFIPPLFVNPTHPDIAGVRALTVESTRDAVVGYTIAMRDRPDNTGVITDAAKPVLIIGGADDKGIPADSLEVLAGGLTHVHLHVLPGVAHMGMFENKEEVSAIIRAFLQSFVQ